MPAPSTPPPAAWRPSKQPRRARVLICSDDTAVDQFTEVEAGLPQLRDRLADLRAGWIGQRVSSGASPGLAADEIDGAIEVMLAAAAEKVDTARRALAALTLVFEFEALRPSAFDALAAAHPPTEADHQAIQEGRSDPTLLAGWHPETFLPRLVQASCVAPGIDDMTLLQMFSGSTWAAGELQQLVEAALAVNTVRELPSSVRDLFGEAGDS